MTVGTFKGRITPLNLTEILKFLKESGKSGLLRTEADDGRRLLYVRRGRVIAAESSHPGESMVALLKDSGRVDPVKADECEARIRGGLRAGRALAESGLLPPAELYQWLEKRARLLTSKMLSLPTGNFAFEEGVLPPVEWMLVDLDILETVLASLRDLDDNTLLAAHLPASETVFEHFTFSDGGEAPPLLPYERYVLSLVNARRAVGEICGMSEVGEVQTRKTLCLLFLIGCVRNLRDETVEGAPIPEKSSSDDLRAIIRAYNEMFSFIYSYMIKEVGPIAEHVLDKYLREVREANQALFNRISLGKDGTLDENALSRNVHLLRGRNSVDILVRGLNEFLYSGQLAVKRTLGVDHEAVVIRRLNEIRKIPAALG